MSALNARAIATQGLGFSPRQLAVQGFWQLPVEPVTPPMGGLGGASRSARLPIRPRRGDEILLLTP